MAGSNLIQKSVRLPAHMVDYINQQKGNNFSEKLVGVLDDYLSGDERRREKLAKYDSDLQARESRLEELLDRIYTASRILRTCADVLKLPKIIEDYNIQK